MRLFAEQLAIGTGKAKAYKLAYPKADGQRASREGGRLSRDPRLCRYLDHLLQSGFERAELQVSACLGRRQCDMVATYAI